MYNKKDYCNIQGVSKVNIEIVTNMYKYFVR